MNKKPKLNVNPIFVVVISADAEWRVVKNHFPRQEYAISPYGEWFKHLYYGIPELEKPIIVMQGGWGKVAAAGSVQYAIDVWHPHMIVNLGTCGGIEGAIQRGQIILVEKTIIYDIYEQMGDPAEHIRYYMAEIDNSWCSDPLPLEVIRTRLVSGDRDLFWQDVIQLKNEYKAVAGDWESGAIAWITKKNQTQCLILRGVTDLVGESGGEAYNGQVNYYYENTGLIMKTLIDSLPYWLIKYLEHRSKKSIK